MGFLQNRIRNDTEFVLNDPIASQFFSSLGIDLTNIASSSELNEIIYFTCIDYLSKTMSKMPWEKKQMTEKKGKEKLFDPAINNLLNLRPNPLYNASVFWACTEIHRLHYGNSYAYIEFQRGRPKWLWLLPANKVQIWRDDRGIWGDVNSIWYVWSDSRTGKQWKFFQGEILHFKANFTLNGIVGVAVRDMLKSQIQSKMYAQGFLKKLYENNMFGGKVILNYTGELDDKTAKLVAQKMETYSKETSSGKFIPLPAGIKAEMLDMKLSDAEFFENTKLSALQLAGAFGLKPNNVNDYSKSSYSNSETQQLAIYVDTLQPTFNSYQQEITYKLLSEKEINEGKTLEINSKILFKMDNKTQSEVFTSLLNNFGMTPNEVREELDLPYKEGADELIGNGNYIKLGQIGANYGIKGGG